MVEWLDKLIQSLMQGISKTIRRFTAYSMILVFIGAIYGIFLDRIGALIGIDKHVLLFVPFILAGLAYLSTGIAIIIFIGLLLLLLIVFV